MTDMPDGYVLKQRGEKSLEAIVGGDYTKLAKERTRTLLDCQFIDDTDSFLEIGCQTGASLEVLLERNFEHLGIDIVPEFVEYAKDLGVNAMVGDAHALPLPDKSFDWVFSYNMLEHCYDPAKAAKEMLRVSRSWVYIVAAIETEEFFKFHLDGGHYCYHTDPLDWALYFKHPDWVMFSGYLGPYHAAYMLFANRSKLIFRNSSTRHWRQSL